MSKESRHEKDARLLRKVRRVAAKHGERIIKVPANSKWHAKYGPFAIADANNNLRAWGIASVDALATQYELPRNS